MSLKMMLGVERREGIFNEHLQWILTPVLMSGCWYFQSSLLLSCLTSGKINKKLSSCLSCTSGNSGLANYLPLLGTPQPRFTHRVNCPSLLFESFSNLLGSTILPAKPHDEITNFFRPTRCMLGVICFNIWIKFGVRSWTTHPMGTTTR